MPILLDLVHSSACTRRLYDVVSTYAYQETEMNDFPEPRSPMNPQSVFLPGATISGRRAKIAFASPAGADYGGAVTDFDVTVVSPHSVLARQIFATVSRTYSDLPPEEAVHRHGSKTSRQGGSAASLTLVSFSQVKTKLCGP